MGELRLKDLVDSRRPITYGIVQAGENIPDGVPYIRPIDMSGNDGVLDPSTLKRTSPSIAEAYRRSTIRRGDIVVSIGPSFGKVMTVPAELDGANLTQGTARVAPGPNVSLRYLYWALQSSSVIGFWEASVTGATFRALNLGPLAETPVRTWPREGQEAIASYLDAETARIDTLIGKRRQQVILLEQRRSAVVVELTTGSRETVGRGQSGVHPQFPLGWARTRLQFLIEPPQAGDWGDDPTGIGDTFVVRAADFDRKRWQVDPRRLPPRAVDRRSVLQRRLRTGDLVLEKSGGGPEQPVGAAVVFNLDVEAVPSNFAARLRPAVGIDSRFLCYAFAATYEIGLTQRSIKQTTGIQNLDVGAYLSEEWAVPSKPEQVRIRTEIDAQLAFIDDLQAASERQIGLLLERREALITAAITGQLEIAVAAA